jgi:hypothetical protein
MDGIDDEGSDTDPADEEDQSDSDEEDYPATDEEKEDHAHA